MRVSICVPASNTDTVCVPASDTIGIPAFDKEKVSMKEGLGDIIRMYLVIWWETKISPWSWMTDSIRWETKSPWRMD